MAKKFEIEKVSDRHWQQYIRHIALQELTFMAKLANQKILFLDLLLISLGALHIMMELLQFIL
jgi:hypothetical protein